MELDEEELWVEVGQITDVIQAQSQTRKQHGKATTSASASMECGTCNFTNRLPLRENKCEMCGYPMQSYNKALANEGYMGSTTYLNRSNANPSEPQKSFPIFNRGYSNACSRRKSFAKHDQSKSSISFKNNFAPTTNSSPSKVGNNYTRISGSSHSRKISCKTSENIHDKDNIYTSDITSQRSTLKLLIPKGRRANEFSQNEEIDHMIAEHDPNTVDTWIYPKSDEYTCRDYQKNIVTSALFHNTLVVLPTGLGKTFIAAVVMYNYLRWFPTGKIIFMAPTRPLVTQQIRACHNIVGIDTSATAELMGSVRPAQRKLFWQEKRVFYCTPQTAEKDCNTGILPMHQVSLVVVDEAHRATGKYAYVRVINSIRNVSSKFRVLALSATPGKDFDKVQEVVTNLLISRIEYKSESDPDVKPYVFNKMLEVIEVKPTERSAELVRTLNSFCKEPLDRLWFKQACTMLKKDVSKVTHAQVLQAQKHFFARSNVDPSIFFQIQADFGLLLSLLHTRKLLMIHGLNSMISQIKRNFTPPFGKISKVKKNLVLSEKWKQFLRRLNEIKKEGGANPKVDKLIELLNNHFDRMHAANQQTSVIVFTQFRDSVAEICATLKSSTNLRVSPFVGQASSKKQPNSKNQDRNDTDGGEEEEEETVATRGQKQSEQQEIVRRFRNGELDVLVATCIGEEGLDIGSVDLIVSFDALASPVRMIQRFGRAGRKRSGTVVCLVTDGKEKETLTSGTAKSSKVHRLLRSGMARLSFHNPNPNLLPANCQPRMKFESLTIEAYRDSQVAGKKLKKPKRKARKTCEKSGENPEWDLPQLRSETRRHILENILVHSNQMKGTFPCLFSSRHVDNQLISEQQSLNPYYFVPHSSRTLLLQSMVSYIENSDWAQERLRFCDEVIGRYKSPRQEKEKSTTLMLNQDNSKGHTSVLAKSDGANDIVDINSDDDKSNESQICQLNSHSNPGRICQSDDGADTNPFDTLYSDEETRVYENGELASNDSNNTFDEQNMVHSKEEHTCSNLEQSTNRGGNEVSSQLPLESNTNEEHDFEKALNISDDEESDTESVFGGLIPPPPSMDLKPLKTAHPKPIIKNKSCSICNRTEIESLRIPLLCCKDCSVLVHGKCYGLVEDGIESFRCDSCTVLQAETCRQGSTRSCLCFLCGFDSRKGAMKQVKMQLTLAKAKIEPTWVHVSCAVWSDHVQTRFSPEGVLLNSLQGCIEPKDGLNTFIPRGICVLCKSHTYECTTKCSDPCCSVRYHVTCAMDNGYIFRFDTLNPISYCSYHSAPILGQSSVTKNILYKSSSKPFSNDENRTVKSDGQTLSEPTKVQKLKQCQSNLTKKKLETPCSKANINEHRRTDQTGIEIESNAKNPNLIENTISSLKKSEKFTLDYEEAFITDQQTNRQKLHVPTTPATPGIVLKTNRNRSIMVIDNDKVDEDENSRKSAAVLEYDKMPKTNSSCKVIDDDDENHISTNESEEATPGPGLVLNRNRSCMVIEDDDDEEENENENHISNKVSKNKLRSSAAGSNLIVRQNKEPTSTSSVISCLSDSGPRRKIFKRKRNKLRVQQFKVNVTKNCPSLLKRKKVEDKYFEAEAYGSGSDHSDDCFETDLDGDLEGFIDYSSQVSVNDSQPGSQKNREGDESTPVNMNDMYRQSLLRSQSPIYLRRGRAAGVTMSVIESQLSLLKRRTERREEGNNDARNESSERAPSIIISDDDDIASLPSQKPRPVNSVHGDEHQRMSMEEDCAVCEKHDVKSTGVPTDTLEALISKKQGKLESIDRIPNIYSENAAAHNSKNKQLPSKSHSSATESVLSKREGTGTQSQWNNNDGDPCKSLRARIEENRKQALERRRKLKIKKQSRNPTTTDYVSQNNRKSVLLACTDMTLASSNGQNKALTSNVPSYQPQKANHLNDQLKNCEKGNLKLVTPAPCMKTRPLMVMVGSSKASSEIKMSEISMGSTGIVTQKPLTDIVLNQRDKNSNDFTIWSNAKINATLTVDVINILRCDKNVTLQVEMDLDMQQADIVLSSRCCVKILSQRQIISLCSQSGDTSKPCAYDVMIGPLSQLYASPIVIIQQDGGSDFQCETNSTFYHAFMKAVAHAQDFRAVRIFQSSCATSTVNIIKTAAFRENSLGYSISALGLSRFKRDSEEILHDLKFLLTIRGISLVAAISLLRSFQGRSLGEIIRSLKVPMLLQCVPGLGKQQAAVIVAYCARKWKL